MMENLMGLLVIIGFVGLIIDGGMIVYKKIKGDKIESNLWKLLIAFGLSFVIGFCFFPTDNTEVENEDTITQEEQEYRDPIEDKEEEDKDVKPQETEEDVDGYVNGNPDPSYNDMSAVDEAVESILHSSYDSSNYEVALRNENGQVKIVIIAKDINLSVISESEKQYAMEQSNLDETTNTLAQNIKDTYKQAGFDVSVVIGLFDVNVNEIYTAYAY